MKKPVRTWPSPAAARSRGLRGPKEQWDGGRPFGSPPQAFGGRSRQGDPDRGILTSRFPYTRKTRGHLIKLIPPSKCVYIQQKLCSGISAIPDGFARQSLARNASKHASASFQVSPLKRFFFAGWIPLSQGNRHLWCWSGSTQKFIPFSLWFENSPKTQQQTPRCCVHVNSRPGAAAIALPGWMLSASVGVLL